MQNRALVRQLLLDLLQKQHIAVVVLLEELKVESVTDFAGEDGQELLEPCGSGCVVVCGDQALPDLLGEALVLVVENIKCDLVGDEMVGLSLDEGAQKERCGLRLPQEELAFDDFEVVELPIVRVL